MPLLKKVLPYLGRQALTTGVDIAEGIKSGQNFRDATKGGLKRRAGAITEDALTRVKSQLGSGRKRPRRVPLKRLATKRRTVKRKKVTKKRPRRTAFELF